MPSLNRATILGNIGRDPEAKYLPDGRAVTTLSIATTEHWKDKASGERKEATEWHRIVFFGRLAEVAAEYLKKGSMIYVEGKLKTRKWTDKDGHDRYTTEIVAEEMQMLSGAGRREPEAKIESKPAAEKKPAGKFPDTEDDIPF